MTTPLRQVSLPDDLCVAAERRFGNLEEFLTFVMKELLRDEAALDQNEQRLIEERLRELGYI